MMTGEPIVTDMDYGHLQIDAVALFLLCLVEMIGGGLEVTFKFSFSNEFIWDYYSYLDYFHVG